MQEGREDTQRQMDVMIGGQKRTVQVLSQGMWVASVAGRHKNEFSLEAQWNIAQNQPY